MRARVAEVADWRILDSSDPVAVAAYEQAFHRAFADIRPDGLLRSLRHWDDAAGRVASPVPYAEQRVYVEQDATGRVRRGMAVNLAGRVQQAGRFGFTLPLEQPGSTEIVVFFIDGAWSFAGTVGFWARCAEDLQRLGLHTGYGTAAARPLPIYRRFGAEVLERQELEGELRFLLRFDFRRSWFVPPPRRETP